MSIEERIGKSIAGVATGSVSKFDAAIEMQEIASELYPTAKSGGEALAQYLGTAVGTKHAADLQLIEYMTRQWNGALGNGAESIIKQQRRGITDRSDGASGGKPTDHNEPHHSRTMTGGSRLNADAGDANQDDYSYDKFKAEVAEHMRRHSVDADKAAAAVRLQWHARERSAKEKGSGGASTKFRSMAHSL